MPLPETPLSLIHAPLQSTPKRAMMVRMSAETFDALENNAQLAFHFGDLPGIYIGDAFFPMRPQKESSPHELYLRVPSAAKPLAPLKLYANVVGKFMVAPQLEGVKDKVRQQTIAAKQQHLERQAILLDQPPVLSAKNQKRKALASGAVPKSLPPPQRKLSPAPQPSKANADLRRRLIHFLAITPRLAEDAVKMVGGANISSTARDDFLVLLDQVAEQQPVAKKGDKSPRMWALKPQSWTEVRPFEWPKLSESARVNMARQARMKLKGLGIPDSDPAWEHVRYRPIAPAVPTPPPVASTSSNRSSASAQVDTKRSVIATKDTKQKSKQDPPRAKGEIQMKDETKSRPNIAKRSEAETAKMVASRRLPGSGYQVKKSPQPSAAVVEKSGTRASLPPKPPPPGGSYGRKTIPSMAPKTVKKEDESDREREMDRQRERERREREKDKDKEREQEERERERAEREKREKLKQREREKRLREKEREREELEQRQREMERVAKDKAASAVAPFKRKTAAQDQEESHDEGLSKVPKRRKLEDGTAVPAKLRDAELPAKAVHEPSPVPRTKMKKDPSPQAPISHDRHGTSSASGPVQKSERSKASGSVKRRRSPIYTSSEDEGEISQPRKRNPSPPPASERSISSDQPKNDRALHRRATRGYPPASDHMALRALYQSQYTTYLGAFTKVVAQRRKIEAMLKGDSEAEVDMMDPEELVKLSMQHKTLKNELEHIQNIYMQGVASASN